jgi:hypothetical protein
MVKELRISANRIMFNVGILKLCVILDSKNVCMVVEQTVGKESKPNTEL